MPRKKATIQSKSKRTVTEPPETSEPNHTKTPNRAKTEVRGWDSHPQSSENQQQPRETAGSKKTRASHKPWDEELLSKTDLDAFLKSQRAVTAANNKAKRLAAQDERRRQTQQLETTSISNQRTREYVEHHPQTDLDSILDQIRSDVQELFDNLEEVSKRTTDLSDTATLAAELVAKLKGFGFEPPGGIADIMGGQSQASRQTKINEDDKVFRCKESNVARFPKKDFMSNKTDQTITSAIIADSVKAKTKEDAPRWLLDMAKSMRSNEAVFQRTIMMRTINRFHLEALGKTIDWTAETEWKNPRPESRFNVKLWAPKPDLTIGFQPDALFKDDEELQDKIPQFLVPHMLPEMTKYPDEGRAFPFLTMEVKGPSERLSGESANLQSINEAAQALFNIWRFMREDQDLEKRFFENVRVFTAGGHKNQFWVRIHRAVNKSTMMINDDYPLRFQYYEFLTLEKEEYTQARVRAVVHSIIEWAIKQLLPSLREAVEYVYSHANEIQAREIQNSTADNKKPDPQSSNHEQSPSVSQESPVANEKKRAGNETDTERNPKNIKTKDTPKSAKGGHRRGLRSDSQQDAKASFGSGTHEATNKLANVDVADAQ